MVGARQHVVQEAMATRLAQCLGASQEFRQLSKEQQCLQLAGVWKAAQMVIDRETAILGTQKDFTITNPNAQMGLLTCIEVLKGARACTIEIPLMFEVGKRGNLHRVQVESKIVVDCIYQRMRVLEMLGTLTQSQIQWHMTWSVGFFGLGGKVARQSAMKSKRVAMERPFGIRQTPLVPFLQYTTKLGIHLLLSIQGTFLEAVER